tara:strand:+ start:176 stop:277 length:102 start_codon:yes stop_codon:yes gene_type:complete
VNTVILVSELAVAVGVMVVILRALGERLQDLDL